MNENYKYGTLIAKLMRDKITEDEAQELDVWLLKSDANMKVFEALINDYKADWARSWFKAAGVSYRGIKWKKVTGWYKPEHKHVWDFYLVMAAVLLFMVGVYFLLEYT